MWHQQIHVNQLLHRIIQKTVSKVVLVNQWHFSNQ